MGDFDKYRKTTSYNAAVAATALGVTLCEINLGDGDTLYYVLWHADQDVADIISRYFNPQLQVPEPALQTAWTKLNN